MDRGGRLRLGLGVPIKEVLVFMVIELRYGRERGGVYLDVFFDLNSTHFGELLGC